MTLEAKEYEFDNVIEDVKKVNFEKFPQFNGLSDLISLFCMFHEISIIAITLFRKWQQSRILLLMLMILNPGIFNVIIHFDSAFSLAFIA